MDGYILRWLAPPHPQTVTYRNINWVRRKVTKLRTRMSPVDMAMCRGVKQRWTVVTIGCAGPIADGVISVTLTSIDQSLW